MKASIRREVRRALQNLSPEDLALKSNLCIDKLATMEPFLSCKSLCCYASMPLELSTQSLLARAFSLRKKVYLPAVFGPGRADMNFVEVESAADINFMPKSKWGIPEPLILDTSAPRVVPAVDLVIVPGVAYDDKCRRYYTNYNILLCIQCNIFD